MAARTDQYSAVSVWLHWLIAGLVALNLILGLLLEAEGVFPVHASVGITILALTLVRLGWRLAHPWPRLPDGMELWEKALARFVPLGGWAAASANPKVDALRVWGLPWFKLPVERSEELSERIGGLHESAAFFTLVLIALHVSGALWHTYVKQDGVLARMNPALRRTEADTAQPVKGAPAHRP